MPTRRLIVIISISFSLLVNIPRILFLFGHEQQLIKNLFAISLEDTIFRILMLFAFCYVVLKCNLSWLRDLGETNRTLVIFSLNLAILLVWILIFELVDFHVYRVNSYTISPKLNTFIYFFVLSILLVVAKIMQLQNQSKLDTIEKERLIRKSMQSELEALKNQTNPHFLFNSLNSLSFLIREDSVAALKFVNKLSFLYRYILRSTNENLATLKEELKFLESYIYLISERNRENFNVNINIDENLLNHQVPTLALQLLMENVVKHNEISDKKPLHVDVFNQGERLVIKNNLQERTGQIESNNMGLRNLNMRFKLHIKREIEISKDENYFIVKIPLV